ncbi:hypothetical protein GNF10_22355 [Nostoc sp. UCD121]|uniref:hypothetical protein n=1 Tax=unclassified Nostoc TaxID=2593658 RepID=UPI0016284B19|nr:MULTISPECIES: hypothetical protein [unclassified Nostoc]MBC1225068.1 hypothetical protein [Nostoc sp. UCD120]MBC1278632.1 hypothetical protein [Nostoc sp. UCD121]MBC1299794.1 hypothetical protein [Nostoc sp. UCD122]
MYDGITGDSLAENLKNNAIACCPRMSDRFAENLKNKAIVCCRRVSALAKLTVGIAL